MNRANHQAIALHLPQSLGEHFLADVADKLSNPREAENTMLLQHLEDEHRALVRHAFNDLPEQRLSSGSVSAGSGIGRGLAEAFHTLGNQVVIAGCRKQVLEQTTAANPGMTSVLLDLEDAASMRALATQLAATTLL
jgi:hypothetical protein